MKSAGFFSGSTALEVAVNQSFKWIRNKPQTKSEDPHLFAWQSWGACLPSQSTEQFDDPDPSCKGTGMFIS